jgi:hypothetical protein
MARPSSPFRSETPVLWMDPQTPPHALAVRHLLWPAWSYVVLAPRVQPRHRGPLNIVDEAFLRLMSTGMRGAQELERTLHLDRALVAYVRADLTHRNFCDEHGVPTESGLRALRDRSEREEELCHGHVYREPTTGALWGRFVEQPAHAEVEWRRRNPRLVLGPEGRAERVPVLAVAPEPSPPPAAPRAEEVLREIELHRRALDGADPHARHTAPEPSQLERITLVRPQPEPVWLAVPVYATRIEDDGAPWHTCDPFGTGPSPPLRRAIERRMADHPELAALLDELTSEGTARRGSAAMERSRQSLRERFDERLQDVPGLQGSLIDMQAAVAEAGHSTSASTLARTLMRRLVEDALRLTFGNAGAEIANDLAGDQEHDSELIAEQTRALGFELPPRGIRLVGAGEIRAAAEHRVGSARSLLAAGVLAAALDPWHPLRALAARWPSFPTWIDALADERPTHEQAPDPALERRELERLMDRTLDTIEWMLTTRDTRALEV